MTTETATDIAALVGEMEALECEHGQHGTKPADHTDETARHYIRFNCAECGHAPNIYAARPGFVAAVMRGSWIQCLGCKNFAPSFECMAVLGPVAK